jgi:outer membrane protein assembly factor BamA
VWRYDGQDSPAVPSRGLFTTTRLTYTFDGPVFDPPLPTERSSIDLAQYETTANRVWSFGYRNRVFAAGGLGTSFDASPLPTDQFWLGKAFQLGAYNLGEVRGDHYYLATAGYLRELGRLPDFLGGSFFAGGWVENGDAFNDWNKATLRTQVSGGFIADTLLGPAMLATTVGFDGAWRVYIGVGRIFR